MDTLTPGFADATRQHLQHDMEEYTQLFAAARITETGVDWAQAQDLRDHLLRTLALGAITAKAVERGGDAFTLETLTDAWQRGHHG